jgi:hypothetical protein
MQIEIDTEILETIFTHATTAARLASCYEACPMMGFEAD